MKKNKVELKELTIKSFVTMVDQSHQHGGKEIGNPLTEIPRICLPNTDESVVC